MVAVPAARVVAVVIPAHGDVSDLRRLGMHLARLDWPRADLRVVVAVDGPDDALERCARELADVVVVLPRNAGSYAARNAALDALADEVEAVLFTDTDCQPAPEWVRAHIDVLTRHDMSGGAIDVTWRRPDRPTVGEFIDKMRHLHQENYVRYDGYAATANLAVRRRVVDQVRFDPRLRSGGDNEFGTRARAAGFDLVYSPDAVVVHPARRTHAAVMRKIRRIVTGIEGNPERWRDRDFPDVRFSLAPAHQAWVRRLSRNPVWLVHSCLLQYRAERNVGRAVDRARASLQP